MRLVSFVFFLVLFPLGTRASSVESKAIENFLLWATPEGADPSEWQPLLARVDEKLRGEIAKEPTRALSRSWGLFGETIQQRIEREAEVFADILRSETSRLDRAIVSLSSLAVVLARNRGNRASIFVPVQALALSFAAVGTPLIYANVGGPTGVLLDLIALSIFGCGLHPVATHFWEGSNKQKCDVAERMAHVFWTRVGERWREFAPEALPADADWLVISDRANAALGADETEFKAACERWLTSTPTP